MNIIVEKTFSLNRTDPITFCGINDRNLKIIEDYFDVVLSGRGEEVIIRGEPADIAKIEDLFSELIFLINKNKKLSRNELLTTIKIVQNDHETVVETKNSALKELNSVVVFTENSHIAPKSKGQAAYHEAVQKNDIVFCIGPAGTGKTYLAVAMAVNHLKNKIVNKIILARPAVEAGESLGYLPGDFKDKIDPYLRPLYDALTEMMPREILKRYMDMGDIEVIPLAYMRGRTLNNAFVLLDEAQNSTFLQMKMFLTRLGFNSKCVINGDVTQIDLPNKNDSGLSGIERILSGIDGIEFIHLSAEDVVRHRLVKKIINAYNKADSPINNEKNKIKKLG